MTGEETIGKRCIHCGIMSEHGTVAEDHGHYTRHYSYGIITHKDTGEVYYFGGEEKCTNKYGHQFTIKSKPKWEKSPHESFGFSGR